MRLFAHVVRTYVSVWFAYSRDSPRHTSSHGRRVYVFAVRQRDGTWKCRAVSSRSLNGLRGENWKQKRAIAKDGGAKVDETGTSSLAFFLENVQQSCASITGGKIQDTFFFNEFHVLRVYLYQWLIVNEFYIVHWSLYCSMLEFQSFAKTLKKASPILRIYRVLLATGYIKYVKRAVSFWNLRSIALESLCRCSLYFLMELGFGGINTCPVNSEKNTYLFRDYTWNVFRSCSVRTRDASDHVEWHSNREVPPQRNNSRKQKQ